MERKRRATHLNVNVKHLITFLLMELTISNAFANIPLKSMTVSQKNAPNLLANFVVDLLVLGHALVAPNL